MCNFVFESSTDLSWALLTLTCIEPHTLRLILCADSLRIVMFNFVPIVTESNAVLQLKSSPLKKLRYFF